MFKEITIRNFKAITDLTIKLTPFTVLIGENSCGKSTVLQALDLLCSLASRDIDEYLRDRGWTYDGIRSQHTTNNSPISFVAKVVLLDVEIEWSIAMRKSDDRWEIEEKIADANTGESYIEFGKNAAVKVDFLKGLSVKSSVLKLWGSKEQFNADKDSDKRRSFVVCDKLQNFLKMSDNYELLSPTDMRNDRADLNGESFAEKIHRLGKETLETLSEKVSEITTSTLKITTERRGHSIELFVEEEWGDNSINVKKRYISDGLLRIIELCFILLNFKLKDGFVFIDEIEDGINPDLAEKLIGEFQKTGSETNRQFIITSHSPIMVNFVNPENIVFMWRDTNGEICAKPLFEVAQLKDDLAYFSPGEAWYHYTKEELVKLLSDKQGGDND